MLVQPDNNMIKTRIIPGVNRKYFFIKYDLSDTNLLGFIEKQNLSLIVYMNIFRISFSIWIFLKTIVLLSVYKLYEQMDAGCIFDPYLFGCETVIYIRQTRYINEIHKY